ncbi:MAG TPA: ATP-binding cassette domain-containing protein [Luteimonas sp.]|nr:ATP-binding cassette domain-containing protein [Luteimonas sp.]
MDAIRTLGLTRRFDATHGVADLDLAVPAGGIYGFLGPNGAGKTTTIRLLLGLLRPQAGSIAIFGEQTVKGRAAALTEVGSLVESPSLYPHLTGRDNLEVARRLLGAPRERVGEALERVGLSADAGRKVAAYSLGMRQRLGLALALLNRPRLLILDEPGNGLDPAGTQDMRALIRSLASHSGITIFLSSHLLSEVEQVATHIGVLQAGRLRFQGELEALRGRLRGRLMLGTDQPDAVLRRLHELGERAQPDPDADAVIVHEPLRDDAELLRALVSAQAPIRSFHRERPTLETLFFDLTAPAEAAR